MIAKLYPGTPAARGTGLPIELSYTGGPDLGLIPPALGRELQPPGGPSLTLDASGRFKFLDLKPGTYHLEFKSPGAPVGSRRQEVWVVFPGLALGADESIDVGDLIVVRPRR